MDAFCHVSLTQVAAASRHELTMGRTVLQNGGGRQDSDGEDAEEGVPGAGTGGGAGAGGGSRRDMEAEGLAAILDRQPDLAQRIEQESRALAAARHAEAAAAAAALQAQAESAEALGERLQAALRAVLAATDGAMQRAKAAGDELEAAVRRLPLDAAPLAREAARRRARQAEAAVVDIYLAALEILEMPALAAAQANAEFDVAAEAINAAAAAGDAAGRTAALLRLRAAADTADQAARDAGAWCMRAQMVDETSFAPRLADVQAAVRAAADGGDGESSGAESSSAGASGTSLAEVKDRILAAMDRIRRLQQDSSAAAAAASAKAPAQPTGAAPAASTPAQEPAATPVGLALGAVLKVLENSSAQQAQQQSGLADTPSAVHLPAGGASSGGAASQQSSTAIDAYLAQLAAAALQQNSNGGDDADSMPPSRGEESYGRVQGAVWGSRSTRDALRQLGTAPQQAGDEEAQRRDSETK